ncbi:MAG: hypothetical protein V1754_14860 [Pseudomonadota bacterium]
MQEGQKPSTPDDILRIARDVLGESAIYVEHIGGLLAMCAEQLQAGADKEAMMCFARGTSDLEQFVRLLDQMWNVARPERIDEITSFKEDLSEAVRSLETALVSQDYVALSDQIEGGVLPLLPRWEGVALELSAGLEAQGA